MFFDLLANALYAETTSLKANAMKMLMIEGKKYIESPLAFDSIKHKDGFIYPLKVPSYSGFCRIVHPCKIRRPKYIKSETSLAKILHSIAHIEYSAIDLALDAMYRFRDLPLLYYRDWFEVAQEEFLHFSLLNECLQMLGYEYGDFPVHTNLFDAQKATLNLNERMALLHKGLEANGLDANPYIIDKLQHFVHPLTPKLLDIMHIILKDEITHVKKGDRWWRYVNANATEQDFLDILRRFHAFYHLPKVLNTEARLLAGFSHKELELLSALH